MLIKTIYNRHRERTRKYCLVSFLFVFLRSVRALGGRRFPRLILCPALKERSSHKLQCVDLKKTNHSVEICPM